MYGSTTSCLVAVLVGQACIDPSRALTRHARYSVVSSKLRLYTVRIELESKRGHLIVAPIVTRQGQAYQVLFGSTPSMVTIRQGRLAGIF